MSDEISAGGGGKNMDVEMAEFADATEGSESTEAAEPRKANFGEVLDSNGNVSYYTFGTSDVDLIFYDEVGVESAIESINAKREEFFDLVEQFLDSEKALRDSVSGLHFGSHIHDIPPTDSRSFQGVANAFRDAEKAIRNAAEDIKQYSANPDGTFFDGPAIPDEVDPKEPNGDNPNPTPPSSPFDNNPTPSPKEPEGGGGGSDDGGSGPKAGEVIDSDGIEEKLPDISDITTPTNPGSGTNGGNSFNGGMTGTGSNAGSISEVIEHLGTDIDDAFADALPGEETVGGLSSIGSIAPGQLSLDKKDVKSSSSIGLALAAAGAAAAGATIGGGIYVAKKKEDEEADEDENEESLSNSEEQTYERLDGFSSIDLKNEILKLDEEEF